MAFPAASRVSGDTRTRFLWLVVVSLIAHLVLTPFGGWLGLIPYLFPNSELPPPEEELSTIPIELFEDFGESEQNTSPNELPPEDPVALIEELIPEPAALPVEPEGAPSKPAPPAPRAVPPKPAPTPSAQSHASTRDAGAPPPKQPRTDGGARRKRSPEKGEAEAAPSRERRKSPREIEDPVALSGKSGTLVEKEAYVALILYFDQIRSHPVGERLARLLPSMPQWQDFFAGNELNLVRDFDRISVIGKSFYNSAHIVAALQYNTKPELVRAAIDRLVQRDGEWLKNTKVPMARAHADRADRVFAMPAPGMVFVVPPKLRDDLVRQGNLSIPPPKGNEGLVAKLVEPWKPLARYNIEIPKSVEYVVIRLTPLPRGQVRVELRAEDESPEAARATARQVTETLNTLSAGAAGVSALMRIIGAKPTITIPPVQLKPDGKKIYGSLTLSAEQVNFLMGQLEEQVRMWNRLIERRSRQPSETVPRAPSPRPSPASSANGR